MIVLQLDSEQLSGLMETTFRKMIAEIVLPSAEQETDILFTVEEAANFLHLSIATIYTKISKRELPVIKNKGSKRCYFSKSDLVNYLKSGRQKTMTEIEEAAEKHLKKNSQKKC